MTAVPSLAHTVPAGHRRVDRGTAASTMPDLAPLFPVLLATHVGLAVALFVPSLVLPFTLRSRRGSEGRPGGVVRGLLWVQANGTTIIGVGLAITGISMLLVLGPAFLEQPWLMVSLATYAVTAVVVFAYQRPSLRSLLRRGPGPTDEERAVWREGARRQRYIAYGVTTAVGLIAFLMMSKPALW
jgi:hypothetical protein